MEPTQPQKTDVEAQEVKEEKERELNNRKLLTLTVSTMSLAAIIGITVVLVLNVIGVASLLGGYLNSIPRIMERRETNLAGTDSLYSHDFTVRGEIAALLYDATEADDPRERLLTVKETIEAAGIVLVDRDGNIVCDSESVPVEEQSEAASTDAATAGKDASDGGAESAVLDTENMKQVIDSDEELVIINENPTGIGADAVMVVPEEDDDDETASQTETVASAETEAEAESQTTTGEDQGAEAELPANTDGDDPKEHEAVVGWHAYLNDDKAEVTGTTTEEDVDGTLYVYYRAEVKDGSTLIIKFDPTTSLHLNKQEEQWDKLLKKLVEGLDAYSFVREDETGEWSGIALASFTRDQREEIERHMKEMDERVTFSIPFAKSKGLAGVRFGVIALLGNPYLVVRRTFPDRGLTFGIVAPFTQFFPGYLRSALMAAAFIVFSIGLLIRFIHVCIAGMSDEDDPEQLLANVRAQCRGGLAIVIAITSIFAYATVMLNTSAMNAEVARIQRETLTIELDNQQQNLEKVKDEFTEASITQAKALARIISMSPQLRTRSGIQSLAEIVGARYLMLFDNAGKELFSSNSYVGFEIGMDEDQPVETIVDAPGLQAVLLGEPYVISDAIEDESGVTYHVIGALVTDAEGLPDGFLAMAVDTPTPDTGYEDDLGPLMNREDQVAFVVDDESGLILKHSDVSKVGEPVKTYLSDEVLGFSYEGYTWYQNRHVYMSSNSNDGISTIVLYMDAIQIEDMVGLAILIMLNVLLVSSFFYPKATKFCCTSIEEPKASRLTNPYTIFLYGYSLFICVLSIVARISASRGNWPAFSLVFNGIWTKGVNEFSLWSALFFTTQATTLLFFLKTMYGRLTESLNLPSKTFLRLCESLVTYIFVFAIIIVDLSWLGIDTTALIASAGIVSIAVGMGAKDLIADILAGMFIIFESSVHMGDIVEIGGWRGTVTDIGVRTCEITDSKNNVKVINNSRIGDLVNYSRKSTSCTLEFDLPRDNIPVTDVAEVVNGYIDDIVKEVPEVTNSLRFRGIISITDRYYRVKLGWLCDESKRENLTFRLNNAVRLILERARREREEERDRKITGMGNSE